ncbi:Inosine/uridine-preferring nucleoside hydrolase domain-containing protein [Jimgerdemannia flammicorona]|uniref:Inosine/uridine-preferring nucleoside hydrolase domain-containing protein n=1 Tax=Jimgerdemannia flammicorona TaxID=994334 RepID=A0A433D690_9FUNG|nr:Inosine/uridine-preferring nucleoside hydrolase domain-containing protein [Jimgerdemannia flammicorona]
MATPIILDTDPGIDDTLATLLALASPELDVRAITLVHGNTRVLNSAKNIITLMSILEQQIQYSAESGAEDSRKFSTSHPVIAVGVYHSRPYCKGTVNTFRHTGAEKPLESEQVFADYFHGIDGLGELHTTHPEFTPSDWQSLIQAEKAVVADVKAHLHTNSLPAKPRLFTTTSRPAVEEILHQLREAPAHTITIVAIGPLTNLAQAIRREPATFSRVKRVLILGGAIDVPGNTTPHAEFNFLADPHAAQIVLQASHGFVPGEVGAAARAKAVSEGNEAPVHVTLVPLDAAEQSSKIPYSIYLMHLLPLTTPLSRFTSTIMAYAYDVCIRRFGVDYMAVYDAFAMSLVVDLTKSELTLAEDGWSAEGMGWSSQFMDVRVETEGTLTRGMCCRDRRVGPNRVWPGNAHNVEVIVAGDHKRFLNRFMERVFDVVLEQVQ